MATLPPASRHVPALMDELLEEIFIRLPIDDPAILFRAALVCKSWHRLVSGPALRRRLLDFHGSPPLRGFFCRVGSEPASRFVPASSSSSLRRLSAGNVTPRWRPVDSLHGCVLIEDQDAPGLQDMHINLVMWNPTGGEVRRLPTAPLLTYWWNATLICTALGCDHLDCGSGPFQVVLAGTGLSNDWVTSVCVYSSEQRAWSKPVSAWFYCFRVKVGSSASTVLGNALYFLCDTMRKILEYDLHKQELSLISLPNPDGIVWDWHAAVIRAEGGRIRIALTLYSKVYMWSRESANLDNGDARWVQQRVIEIDKMIPAWDHTVSFSSPYVSAVAEHVGVMFVDMCNGLFSIDLKSGLVTKSLVGNYMIREVVPYVSFCIPAFGSRAAFAGDQEPIASALSAGKLI
ncbi:unnamed protein product [Urochloa decumbens]|uniref:F-box domain-containing protein n=1 Tax=Urochloa decumbens TaxID=240449 RepID=A0ABC9FLH3_9POAL